MQYQSKAALKSLHSLLWLYSYLVPECVQLPSSLGSSAGIPVSYAFALIGITFAPRLGACK